LGQEFPKKQYKSRRLAVISNILPFTIWQ